MVIKGKKNLRGGHTVIAANKDLGLPTTVRKSPDFIPPKFGHTKIKAPEGRNLEEPTETAEEAHQSRPEPEE